MGRTTVIELGTNNAIEYIKGKGKVMYRRGVWNKYEECSEEDAIKRIQTSGYGVDVYEDNGTIFVSQPVDSDMW